MLESVSEATKSWRNGAGREGVLYLPFLQWKQHGFECCCCYRFLLTSLRDTCSQGRGVWFYVDKHLSKAVCGFSRQKFNYWDFDITLFSQNYFKIWYHSCFFPNTLVFLHRFFLSTDDISIFCLLFLLFFPIPLIYLTFPPSVNLSSLLACFLFFHLPLFVSPMQALSPLH